jgi:hypothetical protein
MSKIPAVGQAQAPFHAPILLPEGNPASVLEPANTDLHPTLLRALRHPVQRILPLWGLMVMSRTTTRPCLQVLQPAFGHRLHLESNRLGPLVSL